MIYQPFDGIKVARTLPKLRDADPCYAYPQHQIYLVDGTFQQTRSGPNWQGGVMTMTTCKHLLRCSYTPKQWEGMWFAGFAPKMQGENYLLYLAQIERAFDSQQAIYEYVMNLSNSSANAKSATLSPLGDLYHMKKGTYVPPHKDHVRWELKNGAPKWHQDIGYASRFGKTPAMFLYGQTYLFDRPRYAATRPLYRSGYHAPVAELIHSLKKV